VNALSHYSLAASDEEHRRLIALATAEEDRVRDACARAGIGSGHHVVDLGCGPLGALHALASVVGPEGRVVGIDASAAALDKARSLLQHKQSVRFVHADVNAIASSDLPVADADLVFSRLFLLHQHDRRIRSEVPQRCCDREAPSSHTSRPMSFPAHPHRSRPCLP
jgi:trans-aconitate methyltransferase